MSAGLRIFEEGSMHGNGITMPRNTAMRGIAAVIVVAVLAVASPAPAQVLRPLTVSVFLQQPMPRSFTDWQRNDRTLVSVTIVNPPGNPVIPNVRLSITITDVDKGNVVAYTKDLDPSMPRITLPAGPSTTVRSGRDIINANAITIDAALKATAIATNSLPEGNFDFCLKLLAEDGSEIPFVGKSCSSFGVVIPDPPSLVYPADEMTLPKDALPQFHWTPAAPVASYVVVSYTLRVAPVFAGQNPRDAIERNELLLLTTTPITSYQYLPTDRPYAFFHDAARWAWQVQALDDIGKPVGSNEGKSPIYTFVFDTIPPLTPPKAEAPPPPPPPVPTPPPDLPGGRGRFP